MSRTYRRTRHKKQHQQHRKNASLAKHIWIQDWHSPAPLHRTPKERLRGAALKKAVAMFHRDANIVGSPVRKFARSEEEKSCRQRNLAELRQFMRSPDYEPFTWKPESICWVW